MVNGDEVKHSSQLPPRVADAAPGAHLLLQVWRDGKRVQLDSVVVASIAPRTVDDGTPPPVHPQLGLALRTFNARERAAGPLPDGLLIEQVDGRAEQNGLLPGDVLVAINAQAVNSLDDVQRALARRTRTIALLIQREEARRYVPLELN